MTVTQASNSELLKTLGWNTVSQAYYSLNNTVAAVTNAAKATADVALGSVAFMADKASAGHFQTLNGASKARFKAASKEFKGLKNNGKAIFGNVKDFEAANLAARRQEQEQERAQVQEQQQGQVARQAKIEQAKDVAAEVSFGVALGIFGLAKSAVIGVSSFTFNTACKLYQNRSERIEKEKKAAKAAQKKLADKKEDDERTQRIVNATAEIVTRQVTAAFQNLNPGLVIPPSLSLSPSNSLPRLSPTSAPHEEQKSALENPSSPPSSPVAGNSPQASPIATLPARMKQKYSEFAKRVSDFRKMDFKKELNEKITDLRNLKFEDLLKTNHLIPAGAAVLTTGVSGWCGYGFTASVINGLVASSMTYENCRKVAKICFWNIDKNADVYQRFVTWAFRFSVLSLAGSYVGYHDYGSVTALTASVAFSALMVIGRDAVNEIVYGKKPYKTMMSAASFLLFKNPKFDSLKGFVWAGRAMIIPTMLGYISASDSAVAAISIGILYAVSRNIPTDKKDMVPLTK